MITLTGIDEEARYTARELEKEGLGGNGKASSCVSNMALRLKDKERHNGWANVETWTVHLHLSNNAGTERKAREIAKEKGSDLEAGEAIREWTVFKLWPEGDTFAALLCGDMLNRAFARVDWRQIGKAFRED
jgi:hypothetical protein